MTPAFNIQPPPALAAPALAELPARRLAVNLQEAAQMLGICKRTLERERDRGALNCLRIGRNWMVRVEELRAYLARMEMESKRPS